MTIAGDIDLKHVEILSDKWFGPIISAEKPARNLPEEPVQKEKRELKVGRNVPFDAIYKAYHMCDRKDEDYHATDLLSDILCNGNSSRLFTRLVKEKRLFSEIHAFISGDIDKGMLIVNGKLIKGVSMEEVEEAIHEEISHMASNLIEENELQKVKNKIESNLEFSEMNVLDKAMNLSYSELLGDANLINEEKTKYQAVTMEQVHRIATDIFRPDNCSTLYYYTS
jgi:predicted Zn-dependent peptidase